MISSRFAGWPMVSSARRRNAEGRSACFMLGAICRSTLSVSAIPRNADSSRRGRRQFIATGFESPEAGKQISAVHGGDVAWTQRLQSAQVVPIKKMAFETLEPAQGFKRAEVALHQIIDGDVTEIIRRDGRQHGQPDVRW